jgi:uncharacterized protein YbjT (DUF2867 family)
METRRKIAVAGATGRVGRHVVDVLEANGHEVVAMSRSSGVDVVTGEGLAEALEGMEAVVDAATGNSPDQEAATRFFSASARNLQEAAEAAGVRQIVLVSIIGIDRFSGGYNAAKLAQERALMSGPVPVRVLRAAQFHEFVEQIVEWGRQGDVSQLPNWRTQLVSARTVGQALAALATGPEPRRGAEPILEIAGPREERLAEAASLLMAAKGDQVRIEVATDTSPDAALYEAGALLPGPDAVLAGPTFEQWLESAGDLDQLAGPPAVPSR